MALLWAVFNHKRFLAELPPRGDNYTAGIKSRLERSDMLQHFATLSDKNVNWDVATLYTRFPQSNGLSFKGSHLQDKVSRV